MKRAVLVAVVWCALGVSCKSDPSPAPAPAPPAPIRLVTDDLGITHVFATSDADAFYGAGYAMARDRLFQMEVYRRQALGTSAEIFGSAALDGDLGARTFNFARWAKEDLALTRREHPEDAALVDAWTAGVNARIAEVRSGKAPRPYGLGPKELDFVPADWVASDTFAVGKLLAFGLSDTLDDDILGTAVLKLAPSFGNNVPFLQPAYDVFTLGKNPAGAKGKRRARGLVPLAPPRANIPEDLRYRSFFFSGGHSNNWAVDAAHSANGHPILAGDPHQSLTAPSRLWPIAISSKAGGGSFDVVGFSFPGTPGVEMGHNEHLGWTATTNFADVMDIWDVNLTSDHTHVQLGDGDHAISPRTEVIQVKDSGGALAAQTFTINDVPGYGVLLPGQILPVPQALLADGDAILFNWTGFTGTRELSCYLGLDRAGDIDAFERAVDLMEVGAVNFVAADPSHIEYRVHAVVPDRGDPSAHPMPWHIVKGAEKATLWTSAVLGPDQLPHWRDPARGYLVTANNDPWGFTADGDVENDAFYYGAYYANGFRASRIDEQLANLVARGHVTPSDLEALQDDTHSVLSETLLPLLGKAVAAIGTDPSLSMYVGRTDLTDLAKALAAWDANMDRTRGEPIAFTALAWFAVNRTLVPAITSTFFDPIASKSPPFFVGLLRNLLSDRFTGAPAIVKSAGGMNALLVGSLDDTAGWLKKSFGTTDLGTLKWGDYNLASFAGAYGHAQDPSPVGVDGANDTVKVCESAFFGGTTPLAKMIANEASVYRMVTSFSSDGTAQATLDFEEGTSEDPTSPHFGDQTASWVKGVHVPLAFLEADVMKRATSQTVIFYSTSP